MEGEMGGESDMIDSDEAIDRIPRYRHYGASR